MNVVTGLVLIVHIKGEWGYGEYYGERTYRLKCWNALRHEMKA